MDTFQKGARFEVFFEDYQAVFASFAQSLLGVQTQARPLLRWTVALEALLGQDRSYVGFEPIWGLRVLGAESKAT